MKTSKYTSGAAISKGDISMEVLSEENLANDWIKIKFCCMLTNTLPVNSKAVK
jgi:hypothetical protein